MFRECGCKDRTRWRKTPPRSSPIAVVDLAVSIDPSPDFVLLRSCEQLISVWPPIGVTVDRFAATLPNSLHLKVGQIHAFLFTRHHQTVAGRAIGHRMSILIRPRVVGHGDAQHILPSSDSKLLQPQVIQATTIRGQNQFGLAAHYTYVMYRFPAITVLCLLGPCAAATGMDRVSLVRDDRPIHLVGKVLTEAADGGLLLKDRQGVLWAIQSDELTKRSQDEVAYTPMSREELRAQLAEELPGFRFRDTTHYLVCYNTSPAYAQWCGALYERLYRAFNNFWTRRGLELQDPEMPLLQVLVVMQVGGKWSLPHYCETGGTIRHGEALRG